MGKGEVIEYSEKDLVKVIDPISHKFYLAKVVKIGKKWITVKVVRGDRWVRKRVLKAYFNPYDKIED